MRVCRGYASVSFAGEIADLWARIKKPIHAYYVGDFDPSGFDIERNLVERLQRYSGREFHWHRLALVESDFQEFGLIRLAVKRLDRRAGAFLERYGDRCAEIDALPPSELRERVERPIVRHIDPERWKRLQAVEAAEQETVETFLEALRAAPEVKLDSLSGADGETEA